MWPMEFLCLLNSLFELFSLAFSAPINLLSMNLIKLLFTSIPYRSLMKMLINYRLSTIKISNVMKEHLLSHYIYILESFHRGPVRYNIDLFIE